MQRYGGISRYFANLNDGLNKYPGNKSFISALYSENEYIKNTPIPLNNSIGRSLFAGHNNRIYRWNRRYSQLCLRLSSFDVFHPTYFDPYFIQHLKKPFVLTVHDMIYELLPHLFQDAEEIVARKKILIKKADRIISISDHTKNEIVKFYPEVESKISVVHHGYAFADHEIIQLDLPDQYILFIGERWHYKNFIKLVNAVSGLLVKNRDLNLICVGGRSFSEVETSLFQRLGITSQCHQLNATDAELKQIYAQARLFVFPSLQEGFGLPLLEAFSSNCPVVCSNATSLPEIAGEAAIYFNPEDDASIKVAVEKVLYDSSLQQQLRQMGKKRMELFTFDNCLKGTLEVYRSLL